VKNLSVDKIFMFYLTTIFNYKKNSKVMTVVGSRNSYKRLLQKLDTLLVPCQYIFSVIIFVMNNQLKFSGWLGSTWYRYNKYYQWKCMYWHGTGKISK